MALVVISLLNKFKITKLTCVNKDNLAFLILITQIEKESDKDKQIIFKIQYGKVSKQSSSSIKDMLPKNDNTIQVIYEAKRIGSYLSTKCKTPKECKANLLYQFECHGCDTPYIGQTKRHIRTSETIERKRHQRSRTYM